MNHFTCTRCHTTLVTYDHPSRTYCFRASEDGLFCGGRLVPTSVEPREAC